MAAHRSRPTIASITGNESGRGSITTGANATKETARGREWLMQEQVAVGVLELVLSISTTTVMMATATATRRQTRRRAQ